MDSIGFFEPSRMFAQNLFDSHRRRRMLPIDQRKKRSPGKLLRGQALESATRDPLLHLSYRNRIRLVFFRKANKVKKDSRNGKHQMEKDQPFEQVKAQFLPGGNKRKRAKKSAPAKKQHTDNFVMLFFVGPFVGRFKRPAGLSTDRIRLGGENVVYNGNDPKNGKAVRFSAQGASLPNFEQNAQKHLKRKKRKQDRFRSGHG